MNKIDPDGAGDSQSDRHDCISSGRPPGVKPIEPRCLYCGIVMNPDARSTTQHTMCDVCRQKDVLQAVKDIATSTRLTDPLVIADIMMSHPSIEMIACENALVAAAALMAALRNLGCPATGAAELVEVMDRTRNQAITGYCGLTGVCGVAPAIGAVFSVLFDGNCKQRKETSIVMHVAARVTDALANDTGPSCCKSFVWTGLIVGSSLANEYLDFKVPIHRERLVCSYMGRHPWGCVGARCAYPPKNPQLVGI